MREFSYRLTNEPLFLPDILNDVKRVMEVAQATFSTCQPYALVDGKNELGGVFFINDIEPGHQANVYTWVWGKGCVTPTTLRFMRECLDTAAEEYGLVRITARAACKKACDLFKSLGLKEEARMKCGYKSGGKFHTLYIWRKLYGHKVGG
jgi:RimJ/RimL family protein N-acetyltransferase